MTRLQQLFAEQGRIVRASADDVVFARGSKATQIFQVKVGQVIVYTTSSTARDIGICIVKANGIFGIGSIARNTTYIVEATALSDCELLAVEREMFEQAFFSDRELAAETLALLVSLLDNRTRKIEELAAYNLKSRLARWVLDQFREQGVEPVPNALIELQASQKLIAIMAGVSRETVNRQLKKWVQADIVQWGGKNLRLGKPEVLKRLVLNLDQNMTSFDRRL